MTLSSTPGITVYTYTTSGTPYTFVRQINEGEQEWFAAQTVYTEDPILDRATGETSIDLGAYKYSDLVIRAEFDTAGARSTAKNLNGTSGTLTNTKGRSASGVVLITTDDIYQSGRYVLQLTFKKYA